MFDEYVKQFYLIIDKDDYDWANFEEKIAKREEQLKLANDINPLNYNIIPTKSFTKNNTNKKLQNKINKNKDQKNNQKEKSNYDLNKKIRENFNKNLKLKNEKMKKK